MLHECLMYDKYKMANLAIMAHQTRCGPTAGNNLQEMGLITSDRMNWTLSLHSAQS